MYQYVCGVTTELDLQVNRTYVTLHAMPYGRYWMVLS